MFYDVLTVAAIRDELRQKILGGFVQRVLHVSEHSVGCEIYATHERHWLLISAHPQHARVHLSSEKLARGTEDVTPLLLLLRKHVRDGRLVAIDQPSFERILILTVVKRSEEPPDGIEQCKVIIEVTGRYSNVILVDGADNVLDSLKRVPPQLNRYRVVLPHHPYVPPPPQQKVSPWTLAPDALGQALRSIAPGVPLWRGLVPLIAGMSPLLAREIVFRAAGNASFPAAETTPALLDQLPAIVRELYHGLEDHVWSPSVAREAGVVIAFAPYPLTHLGSPEQFATISAAAAAYYEGVEQVTSGEQRKAALLAQIDEVRQHHQRRRDALRRQLSQGQEAERLRRSGEAILAAVAQIDRGQRQLVAGDLSVALDPRLSAVENAQAYFREYKKAKGALQQVPEMLFEEESILGYLDEVAAHVDLATTAEDIRRVAADLRDVLPGGPPERPAPKKKGKQPAKAARRPVPAGPPPHKVLPGGFEVYIGRSARQNEELTFHVAGPEDLWLHARGVPGAHVIVKARGREVPEAVIVVAARLAAAHSQARDSARVAVDCTPRKHVRRVRAGLPGLVNYSEERTLNVAPET